MGNALNMKISKAPYLIFLGLLAIIVLWILETPSIATVGRGYTLISISGHGYIWENGDNPPYIELDRLCWDGESGYACDNRLTEPGQWIYDIIDWQESLRGSIYQNSLGCWLFYWQNDYGVDGNPHPFDNAGYWIECPNE